MLQLRLHVSNLRAEKYEIEQKNLRASLHDYQTSFLSMTQQIEERTLEANRNMNGTNAVQYIMMVLTKWNGEMVEKEQSS